MATEVVAVAVAVADADADADEDEDEDADADADADAGKIMAIAKPVAAVARAHCRASLHRLRLALTIEHPNIVFNTCATKRRCPAAGAIAEWRWAGIA
ncbi:hypothetical protein WAE61_19190, partial [Comamonadaceae bacterium PP-2]